MKKTILNLFILFSVVVLALRFTGKPVLSLLGYQPKAGIKITSTPKAEVVLNNEEVGDTPYQNEGLAAGEYEVSLIKDGAVWKGRVKLTAGTLTVVNRELAPTSASSSGEVLTLVEGQGVVITSQPHGTEVEIDNKVYGKTPLMVVDLPPGEHTFIFSHPDYLKRSIRASLPEKLALYLDVDLALSELEFANTAAPALPAQEPLEQKLTVKKTSVGFLRVREKPTIQSREVTRVKSGDILILLEELSGWYKVRLENNVEGYVSASYVQKVALTS